MNKTNVSFHRNLNNNIEPIESALRPNGSRQLILSGVIGVSLSSNVTDVAKAISRYRRVVAISPPRNINITSQFRIIQELLKHMLYSFIISAVATADTKHYYPCCFF
jgi:hypothetical protein